MNYQDKETNAKEWVEFSQKSGLTLGDTKDLYEQGNQLSKLGNDLEAVMCYRLASLRGDGAAKQAEELEIKKMDAAACRLSIYPETTARNWLRGDVPYAVSIEGFRFINSLFEHVKIRAFRVDVDGRVHSLGETKKGGVNYEIVHERKAGIFGKKDRISIHLLESDVMEIKYERSVTGKSRQFEGDSSCRHTIEIKLTNKCVRLVYEPGQFGGISFSRFQHSESVNVY